MPEHLLFPSAHNQQPVVFKRQIAKFITKGVNLTFLCGDVVRLIQELIAFL